MIHRSTGFYLHLQTPAPRSDPLSFKTTSSKKNVVSFYSFRNFGNDILCRFSTTPYGTTQHFIGLKAFGGDLMMS